MSDTLQHGRIPVTDCGVSLASARTRIFRDLVMFLNENYPDYVILGNTMSFPDVTTDIDLCVEDVWLFVKVLRRFCMQYGYRLIRADYHATGIRFDIYFHLAEYGPIIFPGPDVLLFPTWKLKGSIGLHYSQLLASRIQTDDGYYVPAPSLAFLYYFVRQVDKGAIQSRQGEYLSHLWGQDPAGCRQALKTLFNEQSVNFLENAAQQNEWRQVTPAIPELYAHLKSASRPSLRRLRWTIMRYIHRTARPSGAFIAVFGPDGCGKSTVISEVLDFMLLEFRSTRCIHLRPRIGIPPSTGDMIVTDPHGDEPRSCLGSIAKLIYFITDYVVGYLMIIRPAITRSGLIVFDRYFQDIFIDPRRYRFGAPLWMARLAAHFIPSPDLCILLDAPAEVLQSRKQEVPFHETERQRTEYLRYFGNTSSTVIVNANQDVASVTAEVNTAVLEFLAQRTDSRLT